MPLSSFQIASYGFERHCFTHTKSFSQKSTAVSTPLLINTSAVFGPIPQTFPTGTFARKFDAVSFSIIVNPFGFTQLDATFAKTFVGASPIDTESPSSSFISFLICSAISLYVFLSVLSNPVISAKHSSILYSSTSSAYLLTMSNISPE